MIVKRVPMPRGPDWLSISNGKSPGYMLDTEEAMDMARIIMDLVNDIRHEQGYATAFEVFLGKGWAAHIQGRQGMGGPYTGACRM
jgi:hypothetical protein